MRVLFLSSMAFLSAGGCANAYMMLVVGSLHSSSFIVCYTLLLLTNGLKHARAYGTHVAATNQLAEKNEVVSLLLREFEDSSADWLWQTDVGRRVTHVSARFARALSMDVTEVEGKQLLQLLAGSSWRSEEHTSELKEIGRAH